MSVEIRKITRESLMIFVVGVALLGTVILFRYVIIPQITAVRINMTLHSEMESLISSEAGLTKVIGEISGKNEKIQKKLDAYNGGALDNTRDISGFLEHLINCAKASDVRFVKIEPGKELLEKGMKLYPVTLQFTSTYHALGQFVSAVEKNPQMYKVEGLLVEARSEGKIEVKLGITCIVPVKEK